MNTTTSAPESENAAVAVFKSHALADAAIKELAAAEFDVRKISIIGRGLHSEEHIAGFYNTTDRVMFWGKNGAFWGGLWGLLFGGLFMTIPVLGPIVILGQFAAIFIAGLEGAIVIGGLSALGAALYGIGIPKDTVLKYEEAVKTDGFVVIVHGSKTDVQRARGVLQNSQPMQNDLHENISMTDSAKNELVATR